jgi:hypothetical protein
MGTFLEIGPDSELSSFCLCVLQKIFAYSRDSQYVIFVIQGRYYFLSYSAIIPMGVWVVHWMGMVYLVSEETGSDKWYSCDN